MNNPESKFGGKLLRNYGKEFVGYR